MNYTIETDNRDPRTTELLIMSGDINIDKVHFEIQVEVDPIELMENVIDNLPEEDILEDLRRHWEAIKKIIDES